MNVRTYDLGIMKTSVAESLAAAVENDPTFMSFRVDLGVCPSGRQVTLSTHYAEEHADDTEVLTFALWHISHLKFKEATK